MDIMEIFEDILSDDEEVINIIERPRQPRIFRDRWNHFEEWNNAEFFNRFRMLKDTVLSVLEQIEPLIAHPTNRNHAVDPLTQLLLCLRFYASGCMIITTADFIGINKSTASRIIAKTSRAIASLAQRYIKMPTTEEEISEMKLKFHGIAQFPKVIGAIDCTHVRIQSPGGDDAERYRNRKGYFSVNVQSVSDYKLRIQNIVARWPGSAHDATIFNNSRLKALMETNYEDCFLIGDSGYPLENYLMVPLLNPITEAENLYNSSLNQTRNVVERSYGVWKRRFPCLSMGLRVKLETSLHIIIATAILHNIAINMHDEIVDDNIEVELAIEVDAIRNNGNEVRQNLINNYFGNVIFN